MDFQDQYLDIQLCDKHLIYSVLLSKYSAGISKIFMLNYCNILDTKAECSDITFQYLVITTDSHRNTRALRSIFTLYPLEPHLH